MFLKLLVPEPQLDALCYDCAVWAALLRGTFLVENVSFYDVRLTAVHVVLFFSLFYDSPHRRQRKAQVQRFLRQCGASGDVRGNLDALFSSSDDSDPDVFDNSTGHSSGTTKHTGNAFKSPLLSDRPLITNGMIKCIKQNKKEKEVEVENEVEYNVGVGVLNS